MQEIINKIYLLSLDAEEIRHEIELLHRALGIKKETLSNISMSCEKSISFNTELKNETQRKISLKDMLSTSESYQETLKEIQETELNILIKEHERKKLLIKIEMNKNILNLHLIA